MAIHHFDMVSRDLLVKLYSGDKKSAVEIAKQLKFSANKINYWLGKFNIPKRSISEATYVKHNPNGDPFKIRKIISHRDAILFGIGIGLYWGEGTKASKTAVRLGNSDPDLVKIFVHFLEKIYLIDRKKLRFGLQIFSDLDSKKLINFWSSFLKVPKTSFYKTIVSISNRKGTYTKKAEYGVLTVYYNNKKLRDILVGELKKLKIY